MKTLFSFFVLLFVTLGSQANPELTLQTTKTKKLNYEKEVGENHQLHVHSSYGKIVVNTWDEKYIAIEVEILVEGKEEKDVMDRLNKIDIDFLTNGTTTKATSKIPRINNSWSIWGSKKQLKTEVNYIIHMPANNQLNIKHSYGEIYLDESYGNVDIRFEYGRIAIGNLYASTVLNLDYVTKSSIGFLADAKINASYSNFSLDASNDIQLKSDYSQIQFGKIAQLSIASDYGKIEIDEVKNITADIDYLTLNIKHLDGPAKISSDYGKVIIQKLGYNCGNVAIDSEYTQVSVGAFADASFNFGIFADYTSFKTELDVVFKINEKNGISDKRYVGYFGNPNTSNQLSINASYGSIRLTQ